MYWTQIQVKLSFDSFKDPKDQSCVLAVLFNQIHFEVNPENSLLSVRPEKRSKRMKESRSYIIV